MEKFLVIPLEEFFQEQDTVISDANSSEYLFLHEPIQKRSSWKIEQVSGSEK